MTITSPFTAADGALTWVGDGETVRIEPWGANSIRVRARFMQPIADADWALLPPPADAPAPTIVIVDDGKFGRHGIVGMDIHNMDKILGVVFLHHRMDAYMGQFLSRHPDGILAADGIVQDMHESLQLKAV